MNVAFVCQWFPPEPAMVPLSIARALQRRVAHLSVLTGIPNYPTGSVVEGYKAYRAGRETIDGLSVRRTPLYPSHDTSALGRVLNYTSWAVSAAALGRRTLAEADVALVYSSPATAALPAMWAKRRHGTPFVLLIQDLWPDSVLSTGFVNSRLVARLVQAVVGRFVDRGYAAAAHIAVTSPGMIDLLVERGVPRSKISLVYNWADRSFAPQPPNTLLRERLPVGEGLLLMYAGNHGGAQALDVPIRAMGRLEAGVDAHLVLVGDGVEKPQLRALAERVAPGRVHFLEPVPPDEMPRLMAGADVQIVSLRDEPLFRHTMPSKVQTILASGLPLLAVAPGDAGAVAAAARVGWSVPAGDVAGVARAITDAARSTKHEREQLGANALAWYRATMDEQVNSDRLVRVLSDASGDRSAAGPSAAPDTGQTYRLASIPSSTESCTNMQGASQQ
jgi:colanic acid biosynthesis glycosyl transferase WcaI